MYRVPPDLDLSKIVGEFTTQLRVGQFDLQFAFGPVNFAVQSSLRLVKDGEVVGKWRVGRWPDASFFEIMNAPVVDWEIPSDREIVIRLDNGIELHLADDSDQYECLLISVEGESAVIVI